MQNWTYEQSTGKLYDPYGDLVATGYAGGNCGKNPEGINNHAMQNVKMIGPLPCGLYRMTDVVLKSQLGPFAIRLIPDSKNEMFGRSGFFCHGDKFPSLAASEGCIIMPRGIRELMWKSECHDIRVVEKLGE